MFFADNNLPAYRGDWRMVERQVGQIIGLPDSRGVLVCTNGIQCFIEQADGKLYLGHYDWFVADEQSAERSSVARSTKKTVADSSIIDY